MIQTETESASYKFGKLNFLNIIELVFLLLKVFYLSFISFIHIISYIILYLAIVSFACFVLFVALRFTFISQHTHARFYQTSLLSLLLVECTRNLFLLIVWRLGTT